MVANYSFDVKNIDIWVPTFFKHNNSFISTVLQPMELREVSEKLKSMEQLSLNNGNGQSYGYIVYRKKYRIYIRIVIS